MFPHFHLIVLKDVTKSSLKGLCFFFHLQLFFRMFFC